MGNASWTSGAVGGRWRSISLGSTASRSGGRTLSEEQQKIATARAEQAGGADRVRFDVLDYRQCRDTFDRIVSIGIFEHVGAPQFRIFFRSLRRLLKEGGLALLHAMARMEPPSLTSPFLHRYIFPRGYIPAFSEVMKAIEGSDLWMSDLEVLRLHYAETLKHWRRNFLTNLAEIEQKLGARFCRMWEFYLAASEASFRYGRMVVFQMQLTRDLETAPLTRNYMMDRHAMEFS